MRRLIQIVLFLLLASTAAAQGVRFSATVTQQGTIGTATNAVVLPVSPQVVWCNHPANAVPCTNKATTYTDQTLATPCNTSTQIVRDGTNTCVASPDSQNNWGVWVAPNSAGYDYTITLPGGVNLGPFNVLSETTILPSLTVSGTATVNTINGAVYQGLGSNEEQFAGSDIGARINAAQTALPIIGGYARGRILVPRASSAYVMTTAVTFSPYVLLKCENGAVIDYQGIGTPFTFTSSPFIYESMGGIEDCKITNSTNNWTAGVQIFNQAGVHIWNDIITGAGTNSAVGIGLRMTNDTSVGTKFSEKTNLNLVNIAGVPTPIQFEVTNGGDPSFAYMTWSGVSLSPAPVVSPVAINLLNNSILTGGNLWFQTFLPTNGIGISFGGTSRWQAGTENFFHVHCELQASATSAICTKTVTGTSIQGAYADFSSGGNITDSIASGTVQINPWSDTLLSLSVATVTNAGFFITPNGTAAGYACGANCGSVNFDTNTQTVGTSSHVRPPANMGGLTGTMAFIDQPQFFTVAQQFFQVRTSVVTADDGNVCTNGELTLSSGWQSTGLATVTAVLGTGQTCSWTITTGTTTAANPTITDTLTNILPTVATVCEMNIHGGTHTAVAGEGFQQTTLSATAPIFTFNGTPTAGQTTYFVTRRCGP